MGMPKRTLPSVRLDGKVLSPWFLSLQRRSAKRPAIVSSKQQTSQQQRFPLYFHDFPLFATDALPSAPTRSCPIRKRYIGRYISPAATRHRTKSISI